IYQTSDGGRSWESIDLGTSVQLKDVCFVTESTIVIAGEKGNFFQSTNGGSSWEQKMLPSTFDFNALYFANMDSGYIATSGAEIIKTVDGGANWQVILTDFNAELNEIGRASCRERMLI